MRADGGWKVRRRRESGDSLMRPFFGHNLRTFIFPFTLLTLTQKTTSKRSALPASLNLRMKRDTSEGRCPMVSDIYAPTLPQDCEELYSAEMAVLNDKDWKTSAKRSMPP
jgi:hypothetical protein